MSDSPPNRRAGTGAKGTPGSRATWPFSDKQPNLRRLIDLVPLGWDELTATDAGLKIRAMCTVHKLNGLSAPDDWRAVAQAIGFALTENYHVDENGAMANPNLRNYRIPTFADVPHRDAPRGIQ